MIALDDKNPTVQPNSMSMNAKGRNNQPTVKIFKPYKRYTASVPKLTVKTNLQADNNSTPQIHSVVLRGVEKKFTKFLCQNSCSRQTGMSTEPRQVICQKISAVMSVSGKFAV